MQYRGLPFVDELCETSIRLTSKARLHMNQEPQQSEQIIGQILCCGSIAKFAAIRVVWYFAATALFFAVSYWASWGTMDRANGYTIFGMPLMFVYFYFVNDGSETALKIRYYLPAIGAILLVSCLSIPLISSFPGITGGKFVGPLSVLFGVPLLLALAMLGDIARLLMRRLSNDAA